MKKNILLIIAIVLSANIFAQDNNNNGKFRAGIGLTYITENNSNLNDNLGLNINCVYQFNSQWEGSFAYTNTFQDNYINRDIVDLDAHYIFYDNNSVNVYALAGLGFTTWKYDYPDKHIGNTPYWRNHNNNDYHYNKTGLNIGVGASIQYIF